MHPAKKDLTRSENRADFFAFFSAQLSSSEGLSTTPEGDSLIDSTIPISPCTYSPATVLQVFAHFAIMTILCCHSQILFLTWLSDDQHQDVSEDFYSAFTGTGATQTMKTNQMAELKQVST